MAAGAGITLEMTMLTVQAFYWYRWTHEMGTDLVVRAGFVALALLLPLAVAWWSRRSATRVPRMHDSTGQEFENTAGPPSWSSES